MKKKKKKAITLIEIMIVILLIGLIGGTLAYNMRGSLDKGKEFKTDQNKIKLYDILMLEYAKGDTSLKEIADHWEDVAKKSPLVKGDQVIKDGWSRPFKVNITNDGEDLLIESTHAKKKK